MSSLRNAEKQKYGGPSRDLPESDLPTFGDVARCFYKVSHDEKNFKDQVRIVKEQLISVWQRCSPVLPLIQDNSLKVKIERFLSKVRVVNRQNPPSKIVAELNEKKYKLFDIAACSCDLPQVPCNHRFIQCTKNNCDSKHHLCECDENKRVPVIERSYLKDQRAKSGTHGGALQMGRADFLFMRQNHRYQSLLPVPVFLLVVKSEFIKGFESGYRYIESRCGSR